MQDEAQQLRKNDLGIMEALENRFRKIMEQQPGGRSLPKTQLNIKESGKVKEFETLSMDNIKKHC